MTFFNQPRYHVDHLGNVLSRIGHNRWWQVIQCLHIVKIGFGITCRQGTDILAQLRRRFHNLVVNISDIARVLNVRIETRQHSVERIKHHCRTSVTNMHPVVDRWPTDIHRHPLTIYRLKQLFAAGHGVI